jgi:SAM-dependent methyltransferase
MNITAFMVMTILVILFYGVTLWASSVEHFENEDGVTYENVEDMYDTGYAAIYNLLWHGTEKLKFEEVSFQDISLADWNTTDVKVIDMCCGTAPHACYFKNLGVSYIGVDLSDAMLEEARKNCPGAKFKKDDITKVQLFPSKSSSHCLLLNFSIYQFDNPKVLSDNAYQWLQPGGYFIVHLVDPDNFDPVLDLASPFAAFSLQKYSIDRKVDSNIYFDKFKYVGKFNKKKDDDNVEFDEVFTYYDKEENGGKKYRENKHRWLMPSKERLINIIQTSGFRLVEKVHMLNAGKEYQHLCYFQK